MRAHISTRSDTGHALTASFARAGAASQRGFTLVELLIAMVAGVLVSMAAFLLSKNASRFFQHEARIASAQLAVTLGMNRITADLQRASFMSTPNITSDPFRCGSVASYPAGLQQLAGVQILSKGSGTLAQSHENGFDPDALIIGGTFNTTEQFAVRNIQPGANGAQSVYLETVSGPMVRTLNAAANTGTTLNNIFVAGRFLRVVDGEGRHEYGVIVNVQQAVGSVVVNLAAAPGLPVKSPTQTCGIPSAGSTGFLANPIARVRYDIRSLTTNAAWAGLVAPQSEPMSGDTGRTELVRVELDSQNAEIASTLELVSEYAVDLAFGISTIAPPVPGGDYKAGNLVRLPIPSAQTYVVAGQVPNGTPERVRAVQVRLSTRSRAPDRNGMLTPLNPGPDGRKTRFLLSSVPGAQNYVRLRTLYADVALANQVGEPW